MSLPSRDDLLKLPRWARLAFAVQCVRRVQSLLWTRETSAAPRQLEPVERAIALAEEVARQAPEYAPDKVVIRLHEAFTAAKKLATAMAKTNPSGSKIAFAAAKTAEAAEYACCAAKMRDSTRAAEAVQAAYEAAPCESLAAAIVLSWKKLIAAATEQEWTNESPIPERFFRP